ncbi:hypothetical protein QO259_05750 [Salinicola sp. JS01]|uniref:hypothetical protein n=1 Tax=Salinicola sp. JS01 TaxID=3050071 RepID=UPI00255B6572|nr:hypothetical protein [Salinicola sp. JS01]WIX34167.1 hypothetical protein QO259_05750 [Salinicola sp. JS01]
MDALFCLDFITETPSLTGNTEAILCFGAQQVDAANQRATIAADTDGDSAHEGAAIMAHSDTEAG